MSFKPVLPWHLLLAAAMALSCGCGARRDAPIKPDGPGLEAGLSTNTFRVGDVATLSVTTLHRAGSEVRLPDLARDKDLVLLDSSERVDLLDEAWLRSTFDVRFTSFQTGSHIVNTGTVEIVQDDEKVSLPFPFLSYEVVSVLTEEGEDLRNIKPVQDWPGNPWLRHAATAAWVIAALLALAGMAVLLRRRATRTQPAAPPPPADVVARRALEHLHGKGYIETLLHEPFYVELSDIVRHYLEDRFDLHAPEQTTEEFIRETASFSELSEEHRRRSSEFLEQSDLVKFARHTPGAEDMENAFGAAERLVEQTRAQGEEVAP